MLGFGTLRDAKILYIPLSLIIHLRKHFSLSIRLIGLSSSIQAYYFVD